MGGIQTVQKLWEGEQVELKDAAGNAFKGRTFPRPIQPKLPTLRFSWSGNC